jgi:peptide/nickel transport system substrate-binding protein
MAFLMAAIVAVAAFTASAPAAPVLGAAGPTADVVRIAWWTDVGFPTPFAVSTLGPGGLVRLSLIYDSLVWKDETGTIPWLAQTWRVSTDGTAYTFRVRPGIVWHDGRPLTARDVQFSFEYYRAHPFAWVDTGVVAAAVAEDALTVTIRLRRPFAPFLTDIAGIVPIIPEHVWKNVQEPERAQTLAVAVGSGPYRLVDYRPAAGAYRLRANARYFRGRPIVDEIQYLLVAPERQMLAVHSGEVHAAMTDAEDVARAFAGHPYLRVWHTAPLSVARLLFNLREPPFDRKTARQAVAYAVNRLQLMLTMTRGAGVPGSPGLIAPTDPWYDGSIRAYPYDPLRARLLARDASLPPRIELLSSPSPAVLLIQEMLRSAGIDVIPRAVDARTRAALIDDGTFQMALTTHIGAGGDPDYLRRWLTGEDANQFGRGSGFADPVYTRLAREQAEATDPARRRALVNRMQAILAEDIPTLALYYRRFTWVYDGRKLRPVDTRGGLMNGIPLIENKVIFLPKDGGAP